jgi:tetratricopeptide (TPR) repeat protein
VAIVTRCLQKEPVARYGSTLDLAHDLRVAAEGTPSDIQLTPTEPAPPVRGTGAARRWWLPATLVVAVAAMVMLGPWPGTQSLPLAVQAQAGTRHVAILPFLAVSGRADDQVLADGLTETLTSSLSSLERFEQRLRVVPSTEVRRERIASAKEARQAFGATLVISGALQRDDAGLRLTFNLIDSEQLVQVASRTVDLPASERQRGVQDAVAQTVAGLLELQLAPEARRAMVAGGSTAPGAYQSLALGRGYLQRFDRGVDNVNRSIEAFQQAMTADPNFALAHAAAGEAYWRKFELSRQPEWIDRAVEHTERALSIDQRLPSVHVVLAMIARGRGRYEEAAAVAARAIELDPVASDGYRELGRAHEALNRPAEAEATYRRAVAARPDDWQAYNTLGSFLIGRARWDEAIAVFNQALQLTPDNTRLHNNIGGAYFGMGRHDAAAAQWERSSAIRPTYAATSNLGTYYYRRGRYAEAARSFEQAVRLAPNNHRLWRNLGAALYWAPGEQPKAAAAYTRAIELAERERQLNPRQTTLHAELADAYSMVGRRDEALAAAAAVERLGATDAESCFNVASAYEQLGRRRDALHWLQRAVEAGYSRELIEQSPGLAALRSDAAFTDAVR